MHRAYYPVKSHSNFVVNSSGIDLCFLVHAKTVFYDYTVTKYVYIHKMYQLDISFYFTFILFWLGCLSRYRGCIVKAVRRRSMVCRERLCWQITFDVCHLVEAYPVFHSGENFSRKHLEFSVTPTFPVIDW